jgi:dynein heavy chain
MNPGYAGRSELPDNLKALFRPCAMMVPDYALIAQIELFSFGFSDAAPLSVKVVASLRLSSEQLSSQFHYDFGMRAVKSILNACGRQRQILGDWEEDKICLKSLNDVNIPKFTQNDIPLFKGITSDLFPGVVLPEQDYKQLTDQMINSCKKNNVQPKEYFLDKVIQLYETMMVRHGLMVVGDPYAGKSTNINTLKEAMSTIKDDPDFVNVETHFINPKAITQNQLYGIFDIDTQEWSDGVLAIKIRDCSTSETPDRKWVVFDGPVDAVWIENMNTVLDDNKKLCLTSGAIIKLTPVMTIIFEVDDLSQASPATISRCGMVLMESNQLGHTPWITSYCTKLKALLRNEKVGVNIEKLFHYVMDLSVEFCRVNGKYPCAGNSPFLVNHVIRLIETYMEDYKPKFTDGEDILIPNDIEDKVNNALLFGIIWGIGGVLDEFSRPKFDQFLREMIDGEDVRVKYELDMGPDAEKQYPLTKIPNKLGGDYKSLFDLVFVQSEMKWISWLQTCEKYQVDKDASYLQLSIPTIDTIRMTAICDMILRSKMHCLLVGPTGTGKSIQVNKLLRENYQNEDWIYYQLGFSAQTTSAQT